VGANLVSERKWIRIPEPAWTILLSDSLSWAPQSQRKEPKASPVMHSE
jgi:hypothetical protein